MTAAAPLPGQPAPQQPAADVLGELTTTLADLVGAQARAVDTGQTFWLLGLDSLRSVEFLDTLNARYGTAVPPGALYTFPTPRELAAHLAAQTGAPAPPQGTGNGGAVERLREQLALVLGCAPAALDTGSDFTVLGVDSLLAAQFVADVNRAWELTETPDVLYRHPTLASLAAHIATRTGTAGTAPQAPAAPIARPSRDADAAPVDLEALLDAVRDDLLSIDEAAELLGAGPV
ncbi:phosphopantetheine-binding protein [Streptomyces sp. NPDC003470]|uniref:phosphopantetheine-binding protein n=1 Tax=Streptomyces sp. NPDC059701 TaxID=3346914 RepID=UPI0036C921B9